MYYADYFTVGANLAGLPGISVNCGWSKDASPLPVGAQFIAPAFQEARLLAVARQVEALSAPAA
jgi:aspartyl-tRNA(Asn)/glutamyl-tRNA(Gln) amidotransferase subunit A